MSAYPENSGGSTAGEALREELAALRSDFERFSNKQSRKAGDAVHNAASSVREWADTARDKAETLQEHVSDMAAKRPLTTIAVALVAGLVIGKMLGWAASSRR